MQRIKIFGIFQALALTAGRCTTENHDPCGLAGRLQDTVINVSLQLRSCRPKYSQGL